MRKKRLLVPNEIKPYQKRKPWKVYAGQASECVVTQKPSIQLKVKNKKPLTKAEYFEYIKSNLWKQRKNRFMKKWYNRICYICETVEKLQVHHLCYDHVGSEKDHELCTLCISCHAWLHEDIKSTDPELKRKSISFLEYVTGEPYNHERFKRGDTFRKYKPKLKWIE